jgi:hypothetical protein
MHVILIVIGLLLMLFGGGCAVSVLAIGMVDPRSMINDFWNFLLFGGVLGVLPMLVGFLLFRKGLRIDKERRKAAKEMFNSTKPDQTP